ncbi:sugar phosphate isomerase/epimerase family protein [Ollibium composti]|uniref:Sugar phosphate isomerase/epimerase n=1 Tax=Ollibium composti TaxID=2675109 RepID=A0ABY2Q2S9_9HYPH|nr:sugar phosphate isomerase/epimerase family protein [Mesorhizobium composti]THF55295.1 sugar phosphate isomerase/epimerase [Mesorhizobium composti]
MAIAVSTAGYWHIASLDEALAQLAACGIEAVEFFPYPPHLDPASFGSYERSRVKRMMRDLGLRCASVNFTMELNLMALHAGLHRLAMAEFKRAMEIGADLGAPCLVLPFGRRHSLMPAPADTTLDYLCAEVSALADHGQRGGIKVALETLPFDLLSTGKAVLDIVERIGHPNLGICYDCTNTLGFEDPAAGVAAVRDRLLLVHISDSWRDRWAHTSIGRGDIDFPAFAAALDAIGYDGDLVYEVMDGEDPTPRLRGDLAKLKQAGFRS